MGLFDRFKGHHPAAEVEVSPKREQPVDPGDTSGTLNVTEHPPEKNKGDTSGTLNVEEHPAEEHPEDTSGTLNVPPVPEKPEEESSKSKAPAKKSTKK